MDSSVSMSFSQLQESIFRVIYILGATFVASAISFPFRGVQVRYRANYTPNVVQIDEKGGETHDAACFGLPVYGYFAMMKRVWKIEGFSGFYKGFMPRLLSGLGSTLLLLVLNGPFPSVFWATEQGSFGKYVFLFVILFLDVPVQIITNRAIVAPYKLPSFNPRKPLKVLLSPSERRRPWMLYLAPGILASVFLQVVSQLAFFTCVVPLVRLPFEKTFSLTTTLVVAEILFLNTVYSIFSAPLDLIMVRLMIQRNHSVAGEVRAQVEEAEVEGIEAYASEDVIALRDEQDPYLGFVDCAKRIAKEEGWKVFFRTWWVTVLGPGTPYEVEVGRV